MQPRYLILIAALTTASPAIANDIPDYLADYQKCIEDVDGQGSEAFGKCAEKIENLIDPTLNYFYKKAYENPDADFRNNLRDSERAWLVYRDRTCATERTTPGLPHSTIHEEAVGSCFISMTQDRIKWLDKIADTYR